MKPDKSTWKYIPLLVIIRYWILQGMAYMNWVERLYRIGCELLILGSMFFALPNVAVGMKWLTALLITHTLMLFLNGHVIALCVHDLFWFSFYKDRDRFLVYMKEIRARLKRKAPSYLKGAYFWGSLTYGNFKPTSDLDIRFIPETGIWNALKTAHLVAIERWHALLAGFPLDAYMFRSWEEITAKMDVENEPAVCLYALKNEAILGGYNPESFEVFSERFRAGS